MDSPLTPRQLETYRRYIALETVGAHRQDGAMRRATAWLQKLLASAGFEKVQLLTHKEFYPSVLGSHVVDPKLPTILIYGHYDVQPAGDAKAWKSPPFELTLKDNRFYGRGACDNKGQNLAAVFAIEDLLAFKTPLQYNVKFLLEGNEEVGSKGLDDIFQQYKHELHADAVLGIDGLAHDLKHPVVYYSSKGLAYYKLTVHGRDVELHSGYFGGKVYNPATIASQFVAATCRPNGTLIPKLLRVGTIPSTTAEIAALRKRIAASQFTSEARNLFEPIMDVHYLQSGLDELKTVIPTEASTRFSVRLAPGQSADQFDRLMRSHARKFFGKFGTKYDLELVTSANPAFTDPQSSFLLGTAAALEKGFGAKPYVERFAATLPVFYYASRHLNKPFVLVSFGAPDSNTHAVNENLAVSQFVKAKDSIKYLLTHKLTD